MPAKKSRYLTRTQLSERLKDLQMLILDVDGVLTDDSLYIGPDGFELKRFHIGDGLNIVLAMRSGLEIVVVSNRRSPATATRMKDLGVKHVIQNHGDKHRLLIEYAENNDLTLNLDRTAFIGNDIMDVPLMNHVGIKIAVNDAYHELKDIVDYVTDRKGGHGAVREVIDLYFAARDIKPYDFMRK